jgi:hypothetical protein
MNLPGTITTLNTDHICKMSEEEATEELAPSELGTREL